MKKPTPQNRLTFEHLINEIEYCARNSKRIEVSSDLRARAFVSQLAGTLSGMAYEESALSSRLDELGTLVFSLLKSEG